MAFVSAISPTTLRASTASSFISPRRARVTTKTTTATPVVKVSPARIHMTTADNKGKPAAKKGKAKSEDDPVDVVIDENIAGFCSINPRTGQRSELSLRDKESLFLDAMQAYFDGKTILNNEEFDSLKEELTWQGSDVVSLSRDEYRFLEAARSYELGKSTMSDEDFDLLKRQLFEAGSIVAIARGPRCSVQRRVTFSDVIPDKKRTLALYIPATLVTGLVWLSAAYELTPLHQVDPVLSLVIGSPIIYILGRVLTGLVVPDAQIMVGDCPSCGRRTHVLFGNVLNQKGFNGTAEVTCEKCKAQLLVEKDSSRMILLKEG